MPDSRTHFGWSTRSAKLWITDGLRAGSEGWDSWLEDTETHLERSAQMCDGVIGVGRHPARKVHVGGLAAVWRVNHHGGLLGSVLKHRYASAQKLSQEIRLSQRLQEEGVLTPRVLLGYARVHGMFWKQHLVTEEVPDCQTVFAARKDRNALAAADALLDRVANLGLWATDLHPDNLLWQHKEQKCWLIDLAGARLLGRPLRPQEREARRARFIRYFAKHSGEVPTRFQPHP